MHSSHYLLQSLVEYESRSHKLNIDFSEELPTLERLRQFLETYDNCFDRDLAMGHVTGAALITDPSHTRVLLTHHRKLNRWLQLGGHCDGNPLTHETALREGYEESGLKQLKFVTLPKVTNNTPAIFDIDIHTIPARENEAMHEHFDIRYLFVAPDPESYQISEESLDLRWFTLTEAFEVTSERSMHRQFEKLAALE